MSRKGYRQVIDKSLERVNHYLLSRNYGRAFAHYLVLFRLDPELRSNAKMSDDCIFCLGQLGQQLENQSRLTDLFNFYGEALELFPLSGKLLTNFASHLLRLEYWDQAATYLKRSIELDPALKIAKHLFDNLSNALVERWHFPMLNCKLRNKLFRNAIGNAISKNHNRVLDIGTGTGILSMFAIQNGAQETYACEMSNSMFNMAQEILEANSMQHRVRLFNKKSTDMSVPGDIDKRVSLVITETFDASLLGEHVLETLTHAWDNLLLPCKPAQGQQAGLVIPMRAVVWACLIEAEAIRNCSRSTLSASYGRELRMLNLVMVPEPLDNDYSTERLSELKGGYREMCNPIQILAVDFNNVEEMRRLLKPVNFKFPVSCTASGILDALVLWFDLHLDDDNVISTNPNSLTCWEQAIFPVAQHSLEAWQVKEGSCVTIDVTVEKSFKISVSSVSASGSCPIEKRSAVQVPCGLIPFLNDSVYTDALEETLYRRCSINAGAKVLVSAHATGSALLVARTAEAHQIAFLKNAQNSRSLQWISKVLRPTRDLNTEETEETEETIICRGKIWDVLVTNVIDDCGVLNSDAFSELALLRESVLAPHFQIIPSAIQCWAILIQSDNLSERNHLCNDDRTLGLKIKEFINYYQVSTHQDIELTTLPHEKLCEPLHILDINFMDGSIGADNPVGLTRGANTVSTQILTEGRITAIAYWFVFHLTADTYVSTLDPQTHWRQAAIVPTQEISVLIGQTMTLTASIDDGFLDIVVHP